MSAPDLSEFDEIWSKSPQACVIARSAAQLDEAERAQFDAAVERAYPDNTLSKWLRRRGLGGGPQAVKAHREGSCCCGRS